MGQETTHAGCDLLANLDVVSPFQVTEVQQPEHTLPLNGTEGNRRVHVVAMAGRKKTVRKAGRNMKMHTGCQVNFRESVIKIGT